MYNPAFLLFTFIAIIVLWFLLTGIFEAVGSYVSRIFNDTKEVMFGDEKEEKNE